MKPVESSTISHIGYDAEKRVMSIKFKSKGEPTYDYADVEPEDHARLLTAESVGSHLHHHIKPKYRGVKREA